MAKRLSSLSQVLDRGKLLRIDHSDVYLTNERLDEELNFDLDCILYKKCRQRIAIDSEISELRRACRPKTSAFSRTRSSTMATQPGEPGVIARAYSTTSTRPRASTVATVGRLSSTSGQKAELRSQSGSEPNKKCTNRFPHKRSTKDVCPTMESSVEPVSHNYNGQYRGGVSGVRFYTPKDGKDLRSKTPDIMEKDDSVCSDDFSDSTEDTSSSLLNDLNGGSHKRDNVLLSNNSSRSQNADDLAFTENNHKDNFFKGKQKNNTGLIEHSIGELKEKSSKSKLSRGKTELKMNLAILKLDSVPFQWFTTVVQPRDSLVGRRPRTANVSGFLEPEKRLNMIPGKGKTHNLRKTNISNLGQSKQQTYHISQRPQTSIGIVTTSPLSSSGLFNQSHQHCAPQSETNQSQRPVQQEFYQERETGKHLTRSSSFFERSRPKGDHRENRRQLVEQAQSEAGETDFCSEKLQDDLKKQLEDNATEKCNLDLKVKVFLHSLEQMKKQCESKDILSRLVKGVSLE
ncbi:LOW QUALITY PROTEIN: hypothetical protein ElyMa_004950300 [Elysia marginata]|uniref:Uncharacterized protein n=1 Tax=Elysia marginata TaxID=1093978 RepID=A0AAV4J5C2_9GAST|nr:LOW QUALITY PROTEIN: hypothetical protein ElyMa_004950300 [Elysia marginata]